MCVCWKGERVVEIKRRVKAHAWVYVFVCVKERDRERECAGLQVLEFDG